MAPGLTPRERVRLSLNHQEPDQVPISLGGSANHLTEQLYVKLRNHFGLTDVPRRTLVGYYSTPDYNPLLDALGTDFRYIHIRPETRFVANSLIGDFQEFTDEWGVKHRLVSGYYDMTGQPFPEDLTIESIDAYNWPDPYDPVRLVGVEEEIKHLYNETDYALVAHRPVYGNLWEMTKLLLGMEDALVLTILDPAVFDYFIGKLAEVQDGFYDAFLSVVGPYVDVVEIADDYGTNTGPLFDPNVYKKHFMPRYKKTIELIKKKAPNAKVLLHNDGAIRDFIPDIIETGFDILNPIESHLPGMDPTDLKREYGKDLVFQGGVDVTSILNRGSLEDVWKEVEKRIKEMGHGGGYVLAPAHNFGNDVPLENFLAFFEAGKALGKYPL